jgi:hypothetical protein
MQTTQRVNWQRVRTTFDPSANKTVDQIKQKSAELINIVDELFGEAGARKLYGCFTRCV